MKTGFISVNIAKHPLWRRPCSSKSSYSLLPLLSTTMAHNANVQAVLSALDVFTRAPEKAALDQANTWLQDFQHSVNTCFAFGPPTLGLIIRTSVLV